MIGRARTVEEIFAKVDAERHMYELWERGRNDYVNAINTAQKRGREEGKIEALRETARSMLDGGMSLNLITEFTGLPVGEIETLRKPN
ncbi:MAG: hypothetical protein LBO68_01395 [Synergistaceae bacterium]|jgi:predicted transposase/invertase (TIGR01784 family)|nr:hypothetical protein [Synergistaceae bacterium]